MTFSLLILIYYENIRFNAFKKANDHIDYKFENDVLSKKVLGFVIFEFFILLVIYSTESTDRCFFYYDPVLALIQFIIQKNTKKFLLIIFVHGATALLTGLIFYSHFHGNENKSGLFLDQTVSAKLYNESSITGEVYYPNRPLIDYEFDIWNIFSQTVRLFIFIFFQSLNTQHLLISPISIALCDFLLLSLTTQSVFCFSSALCFSILTNRWNSFYVVLISQLCAIFLVGGLKGIDRYFGLFLFNPPNEEEEEEIYDNPPMEVSDINAIEIDSYHQYDASSNFTSQARYNNHYSRFDNNNFYYTEKIWGETNSNNNQTEKTNHMVQWNVHIPL